MANKKIEDLTALGTTFATADLFEISRWTGSAFVSRKITGAEMSSTIPSSSLGTDNQQINSSLENRKIILGGSTSSDQLSVVNFGDTQEFFKVLGNGTIKAHGAGGIATNTLIGGSIATSITSGYQNSYFGNNSATSLTSGYTNTGVGYETQKAITQGFSNSSVGHSSLKAITNGDFNSAVGYAAGLNLTQGVNNTFIGKSSGNGVTTGSNNVLIGKHLGLSAALSNNVIINDGQENQALRKDANHNVIIGAEAAVATTATDGFVYIPTCAGTPTGTPTSITGVLPCVIDSTNSKMYIYSGGAWNALN